ncbi:UNVERIFIED_CONTAM: hypothetical protein Sradi_6872600 [Sesamum radiatum]|uniref:Uncharacterized protein n=1 Tax=Sesamum radiatum TaxID=300843 RepID=A0AAW2JJP4_SESRA
MAEEEIEYESDPEEAKLSLKMRRREASDDEQDGEGGGVVVRSRHGGLMSRMGNLKVLRRSMRMNWRKKRSMIWMRSMWSMKKVVV